MLDADGHKIKTNGFGEAELLLGTQEVSLNILVADIDDAWILGMDFLSNTNASIDVVGRRLMLNEESINCLESASKLLSFRYFIRRSVVVSSNSEMAIPVKVSKRQWKSNVPEVHRGVRLLEPCTSHQLKKKGIFVGSTLVNVSDNTPLVIRVVNLSNEPQTIPANTSR